MTDREAIIESWHREEEQEFSGWDFSHLDGRMIEDPTPWSYIDRAMELLSNSKSVLDMDTGGGERFLEMRQCWPPRVTATEEYPPNLALAKARLTPHGVSVLDVHITEVDPMPFPDGAFDVVLNRHAAFNSSEVTRILTPGGRFLTQQVHGLWAQDLLAEFGASPNWPNATSNRYVPLLEQSGMEICVRNDWQGRLIFRDVAAMVYYLKAVPWLVEDFSVKDHMETLNRIQDRLERGEELVYDARKYLIEARKPQQEHT